MATFKILEINDVKREMNVEFVCAGQRKVVSYPIEMSKQDKELLITRLTNDGKELEKSITEQRQNEMRRSHVQTIVGKEFTF